MKKLVLTALMWSVASLTAVNAGQETEVLEARKAAGEAVKSMEFSQVVADDGGKHFRYMKAIPISEICLKCHGREIAPDVQDQLTKLYPGDQAKGYALGDIRGAFTLSKPL